MGQLEPASKESGPPEAPILCSRDDDTVEGSERTFMEAAGEREPLLVQSRRRNLTRGAQIKLYNHLGQEQAPYAAPMLVEVGIKKPPELKWYSFVDEQKGEEGEHSVMSTASETVRLTSPAAEVYDR